MFEYSSIIEDEVSELWSIDFFHSIPGTFSFQVKDHQLVKVVGGLEEVCRKISLDLWRTGAEVTKHNT